jgi:ATP citrate (pro-S)-lyase
MSKKAVREYDGKRMLGRWLTEKTGQIQEWDKLAQISPSTQIDTLPSQHPWLSKDLLVAKPDQLIKRRGKAGLILIKADFPKAKQWIGERRDKEVTVERTSGILDHFLIEKFWPHQQADEYYICIQVKRQYDEILFYHQGGVDVGDVDAKALRLQVQIGDTVTADQIAAKLLTEIKDPKKKNLLATFIENLFAFCTELHYSYLEINPLCIVTIDDPASPMHGQLSVVPLDMAAKIDEAAKFDVGNKWGKVEFPAPFGRPQTPEEAYISELDQRTGASLKLTVLNPKGRIWTMVAGGGASVIYADTICDLGGASELANYGEYSGAPDEEATYNYARTILTLMTKEKDPRGKILIIGGGIANFTNVAETFTGIVRALTQATQTLLEHHITIYVRRGGPNYQEGLEIMRKVARTEGLPIEVYGPETHMTAIVAMALGKEVDYEEPRYVPEAAEKSQKSLIEHVKREPQMPRTASKANIQQAQNQNGSSPSSTPPPKSNNTNGDLPSHLANEPDADLHGGDISKSKYIRPQRSNSIPVPIDELSKSGDVKSKVPYNLFTRSTRSIIFGLQPGAVQNMLDFDFICNRDVSSVAAVVYPFAANHYQKFYWRTQEVLIPIFQSLKEAVQKCPDVDVVINFSSFRSVFETTNDILSHSNQIKTVAIIAEGVPERQTRKLLRSAVEKNVIIIGPATVGGIKAGGFRIGNTGGALDNIINARLYRPGSVAYVARSGGMSNELNNILAQNSDGCYEGIAIGGDQYPGSTFVDHLLRYQDNPDVKLLVVLGEVGGVEEYEIIKLIKSRRVTKPIVAWCIGTCSKMFSYEVQFGHAGANAGGVEMETADAKNKALKAAGCYVPSSFDDFGITINRVYAKLVEAEIIHVKPEISVPTVPVDYKWAMQLGLIRKPAAFVSSIVDERGEELEYAGMKISEVLSSNLGLGGVIGLIWFRRRLPEYFCRFLELVLMVTADHGPAVAGAHNTIVATRAGKDLISSLCSGLLTIGPRFGGALDGAAQKFSWGFDSGLSAQEFVDHCRRNKELIMGIGHKIKSLDNPDMRVVIVKEFVKKYFESSQILDYACQVELLTTKKKANLILNVDGAIACAFVDLLRGCGAFTLDEANEYINMGALNGLFVLGRTIGFIGHHLDQLRLKQPLYRHPTDDISYIKQNFF